MGSPETNAVVGKAFRNSYPMNMCHHKQKCLAKKAPEAKKRESRSEPHLSVMDTGLLLYEEASDRDSFFHLRKKEASEKIEN